MVWNSVAEEASIPGSAVSKPTVEKLARIVHPHGRIGAASASIRTRSLLRKGSPTRQASSIFPAKLCLWTGVTSSGTWLTSVSDVSPHRLAKLLLAAQMLYAARSLIVLEPSTIVSALTDFVICLAIVCWPLSPAGMAMLWGGAMGLARWGRIPDPDTNSF